MLRCEPERSDELLSRKGARPFDLTPEFIFWGYNTQGIRGDHKNKCTPLIYKGSSKQPFPHLKNISTLRHSTSFPSLRVVYFLTWPRGCLSPPL